MEISLRALRNRIADCDPAPPILTTSQRTCLDRIRTLGQILLSECGCAALTFTLFAQTLRISREKLRYHFADMHALAADLMREHLQSLARAIGQVDSTDPQVHQKRRAAWLAYTRTPTGTLTAPHLLLVRDRHLLPEDELQTIELTYRTLAQAVAGNLATETLTLLDNPNLTPTEIEQSCSVGETHVPTRECDPNPPATPVETRVPTRECDPNPPATPAETHVPTREHDPVAPCIAAETPIPAKTTEPTPQNPTPDPTQTPPGEWIWTAGFPGVTRPPGYTPPHHSNPLLPPPDDDP